MLVGGRDGRKAAALVDSLRLPVENAVRIDAGSHELATTLRALGVETLIHTAGPFQGQDYGVARSAIAAGANYIDLADGRSFVAGISALDAEAKAAGVSVVSGASSVPALSSAVVDHYLPAFARLESIRLGIGSGARSPGIATVRGIFGYGGKPFRRLEGGAWVETHGWLDLTRHEFPAPVGPRWLSSCDVPDLELFPQRYPTVRTVSFHAGFASDAGHLAVWALAGGVKAGLLKSMLPFAGPLNGLSRVIEPLVSDKGAMFVTLEGIGKSGAPLVKRWNLLAAQNHGPTIPCGASIALARQLAAGRVLPKGAQACLGLLTIDEYLAPLAKLDVRQIAEPL